MHGGSADLELIILWQAQQVAPLHGQKIIHCGWPDAHHLVDLLPPTSALAPEAVQVSIWNLAEYSPFSDLSVH